MIFIFISIVFTLVYWVTCINFGYPGEWYGNFTYPFVHANIFHLFINMFAYYKLDLAKKYELISYVVAVAASFFCEKSVPTVGSSGMIFFMVGIVFMGKHSMVYYRNILLVIFISSVIGYFSNTNILLHAVCFFSGIAYGVIYKLNKKYHEQIKHSIEKILFTRTKTKN